MTPIYVTEFRRWRSAPPDQREAIARQQFATITRRELLPDEFTKAATLPDSIAPNGKTFVECEQADIDDFISWFGAIAKAARDIAGAIHLCNTTDSIRI